MRGLMFPPGFDLAPTMPQRCRPFNGRRFRNGRIAAKIRCRAPPLWLCTFPWARPRSAARSTRHRLRGEWGKRMDDVRERFQNLHEFLKVARFKLNRNNWDYIVGGTETETTLARNRQSLDQIAFKPRVLRNVQNVDCSTELFGRRIRIPVLIAPVGG